MAFHVKNARKRHKDRKKKKEKKKKKKKKIEEAVDSPVDDGSEKADSTDNYEIIRALGAGATGSVLLVQSKRTKEVFAQKIVPVSSEKEKNRALFAELNVLKNIMDYPYVVRLENYFREGIKMYVLLEFMDCGSLRDVINNVIKQKKKFPEHIIAKMGYQSLLGLKYLHDEKEVIHRDIKPANILLNCEGKVKLADLGMAGNKKVINNTYVGTMIYMSPERFNGEPHGCNCDIWSMGLSLAECALLNFPFTVDVGNPWGVFEILEKFRRNRNLLDEKVYSEKFRDFIDKTLTIEREKRPEAKTLLEHEFLKENLEKEPSLSVWLTQLKKDKEEMKKKEKEEEKKGKE